VVGITASGRSSFGCRGDAWSRSPQGQLTDDDLAKVNGNREQLEGVLQQRYGYGKDKAKAEIDQWSNDL
jgi:uncharacterized protein YjbJ (UPF0337 family)